MNTTRTTRPNSAPAYYLGRPATSWQAKFAPARSASNRSRQTVRQPAPSTA